MRREDLKVAGIESITEVDMQIARFTGSQYAWPTAPVAPAPARARVPAGSPDAIVDTIPPAPTPEARAAVDRAAARVEELRASNRELHFSTDPSTKRVVIEVRDLEGNVIKTIPPAKALAVMSGEEL